MTASHQPLIDVLVLTAADGEDDALRGVDDGAIDAWQNQTLSDRTWSFVVRSYKRFDGRPLRVAHVHARAIGETTAAVVATRYVADLKPRVLAICGVCAGHPNRTNLGDVVIAEMVYKYDAGEVVRTDPARPAVFNADGRVRDLPREWRDRAVAFGAQFPTTAPGQALVRDRPYPLDAAELWLLDVLDRRGSHDFGRGANLTKDAWTALVDRLIAKRHVRLDDARLALTTTGHQRIGKERTRRADSLTPPAWRIHVEPFGTGSALVRDVGIWDRISGNVRDVHALDMESAAVGEVGWLLNIEPTLVVKGVMDFAEPGRTQHYRVFAARAAAEVLVAFLREHVESRGRNAGDVLLSGIAERPSHATNPGSLLHPRYRVVEFDEHVRRTEFDDLRRWCDADVSLGARLFVGPGGSGKTRLFIEWTRWLRDNGWYAGYLPDSPEDLDLLLRSSNPTFIVVDYAESRRDLREFVAWVAARRPNDGGRLRVALLAREVADWWRTLLQSDPAVEGLLGAHPPAVVTAVPVEGPLRAKLFRAAVAAFAPIVGTHRSDIVPDLSHERFGRPLYIGMAALAAIEGEPIGSDTILRDTVERERRFWVHRFGSVLGETIEDLEGFKVRLSRFMAAVTLRGGIPRGPIAEALLLRIGGPPCTHLLDWLASVYPKRDKESGEITGVAGLEPDLLAEHLVFEALHHHDTRSTFLDDTFQHARVAELATGFALLGRLGARRSGDIRVWIQRLIGDRPDAVAMPALAAALALRCETAHAAVGQILADALEQDGGGVEIATKIDGLLSPDEPSVTLRELRAWAARKLLESLSESQSEVGQARRARHLNDLGHRLSELGRREAALAATEEAVAIRRTLAQARPDAFLPDLAMSVNNLGAALSDLGRREEGLAATEEAVALYRTLAQARPNTFLTCLAASLNNLGNALSDLGRWEAALAASEEAVGHYRTLAQARPDAFLPDLAMSLSNLGASLSDLEQRRGALTVTEEAVAIRRTLAQARPDAFLPDLATSLINLGNQLGNLGRRDEGLAATEEAVADYRTLAQARPDAFLPNLATSLNSLGSMLRGLGRREAALAATEEAVGHHRTLAQERPDAHLPELATSLNNLGVMLSDLRRREAALAATEEAVAIRRTLTQARRDAHLPELATSLNNLGARLIELGRPEAALAAIEEAVGHHRTLAQERPELFVPDLAASLANLGGALSALGRREAAVPPTEEAVGLCRTLAQERSELFVPVLAAGLANLGGALSALGRREAAVSPTEEAVGHYRTLAQARPDTFLPDLAMSLDSLGTTLSELGRREAALAATGEAVTIRRMLAQARPDAFLSFLAASLNNLGAMFSALGQREAALGVCRR